MILTFVSAGGAISSQIQKKIQKNAELVSPGLETAGSISTIMLYRHDEFKQSIRSCVPSSTHVLPVFPSSRLSNQRLTVTKPPPGCLLTQPGQVFQVPRDIRPYVKRLLIFEHIIGHVSTVKPVETHVLQGGHELVQSHPGNFF